ncbi:MAG: hypothetical protein LPK45_10450 [Bacteroidota bacterium]|nr:hypothetical protein [Bacteroidota bacterium]MDX5431519.1 hypothetical protein [Bacteroidota bacterium]MDX5470240.1 hypothetical protein [Bacteroidota bacterium]
MSILLFILVEIALLRGLMLFKIRPSLIGVYAVGYPIWVVAAFLLCREVIPYHPSSPRFDGFGTHFDYLLLLFFWGFGIGVIYLVYAMIGPDKTSKTQAENKKAFLVSLALLWVFSLWAFVGFYATPMKSPTFFVKYNPTFKVFFSTTFTEPVSWTHAEKLDDIQDQDLLKEECLFMEYVSNRNLHE